MPRQVNMHFTDERFAQLAAAATRKGVQPGALAKQIIFDELDELKRMAEIAAEDAGKPNNG